MKQSKFSYADNFIDVTRSTVVLQCYRRQAVPMEQGKTRYRTAQFCILRLIVTKLDVITITSATPTQAPILVEFVWVEKSPPIGEI